METVKLALLKSYVDIGEIVRINWPTLFQNQPECFDQPVIFIFRNGLIIVFVAVFLMSIVAVGFAALDLISSVSDPDKKEQGLRRIKSLITAFVLALLAIFLITILLNAYLGTLEPVNC